MALADEETDIALPFKVLENKSQDFVLVELKKIIQKEKISKIIIGLPLALSGRESKKTKEVQEFISFLTQNLEIPIVSFDERLSSCLSDKLSGGTKGSRDIGAAMIILDGFLSRIKSREIGL